MHKLLLNENSKKQNLLVCKARHKACSIHFCTMNRLFYSNHILVYFSCGSAVRYCLYALEWGQCRRNVHYNAT